MKALVLGATGHIGCAVARELVARGHEVTAASRGTRASDGLAGLPVRWRAGDADEPGRLAEWTTGQDLVVDAASPYPVYLRDAAGAGAAASAGAVRRARALVEAVRREGAALVHLGSFATANPGRLEGLDRLPVAWARRLHPYFEVKRRVEEVVAEAGRRGMATLVVRPTACLGPWDSKPRRLCLVPQLARGEIPALVRQEINVVDVREVAAGVAAAVEEEMWGRTIRLAGCRLSLASLAAWVCEESGSPPPRLEVSASLGVLAASWLEGSLALLGRRTPFPTLALLLMAEPSPAAPSPEQRELGVVPRDLSATVRDSVEWYRRLGYC